MKKSGLLVLLLFVGIADASFAARCAVNPPSRTKWVECTNARPNAMVDQYLLSQSGDLYAYIAKRDLLCSVTNNVKRMKASGHPKDQAVLYFVRQGDLYVAHNLRSNGQNCPEMSKKMIMRNVRKYNVVSSNESIAVNTALSEFGEFLVWDNRQVVYSDQSIKDYMLNPNFGQHGKPYSKYLLFTLNYAASVTKVMGEDSFNILMDGKVSTKRYPSLEMFMRELR